jgi:tight adherence protein B
MKRPLGASLLLAVVAALLALAPAAQGKETPRLTEAGGARFPDRSFVLTLPSGMPLAEGDVEVRENGRLVSKVSLVPAHEAAADQFGVVLVIDASNSMRGRAIEGAVAAARAFAAERNENQQIAIVAFNRDSTVLLPFTTDAAAIDAALAAPPELALGTNLYDAVDAAVTLLEEANVASGSVVVLSDGADTGSALSEEELVERATEARTRIFTVGLRSRQFERAPLERVADGAGGGYSEATSSHELARIYDRLGAQLASEYMLRYRSLAGPNETVHVTVTVNDAPGTALGGYETPPLPRSPTTTFHRSPLDVFWQSEGAMLVVSIASALLLALAVAALARRTRRTLRKRMAEFVSVAAPGAKKRSADLAHHAFEEADNAVGRSRWWTRFKDDLELAEIRMPARQIAVATILATIVTTFVLYTAGSSLLFVPFGLAMPLVTRAIIRRKLDRRRKLFAEQLPDNLQVLASALRAGHSFVGALSVVVDDSPEPSGSEFRRVVADEQLGVPLEDALDAVARRMRSRDLEQVSLVASLGRETGGNSAEVLDRVTETVRERAELRGKVKALTAQGRMSRWVVTLIPVALLGLITVLNPEYIAPLFAHPLGRGLIVVAGVLIIAGNLAIKRIVDIKV